MLDLTPPAAVLSMQRLTRDSGAVKLAQTTLTGHNWLDATALAASADLSELG